MRVSVVCIGNELLMDEGVGPACARYLLSRYRFPDNVAVLDRACMGMGIISDLRACDFMVALDAVEVPGATPGQVFSFAPDDAAPTPPGMTSLHEVRFADVLASAELLGIRCKGHCLGIQVENMSPSEFVIALTPRVAAALPLMAQAAVRYLRTELGLEIEDCAATKDPLRAGRAVAGARDFSCKGVRVEGIPVTEDERECAPQLVEPAVYGDPDCTVMARYLSIGLEAVGAGGVWDGNVPARVETELPEGAPARDLAERFGLEDLGQRAEDGRLVFGAYVSPQMTDYDCDALISACLELVRPADEAGV